jgi:GT2 family glycosyltransferase/glycosyltransferase involved in cell wall biosynthesis/SAM-dependent methyltransferase
MRRPKPNPPPAGAEDLAEPAIEPPPYSDARPFDPPPGSSWDRLLSLVPQGARVLDVGCSYGGVAASLRRLRGCSVVGVELDPVAAEAARAHCEKVYQGDIAEIAPGLAAEFDVIVAADVLEHLSNPEEALRVLASLLRPEGCLLASIPNVTHLSVVLSLVEGVFPRSREGLLDRTHVQFFGESDVLSLFGRANLVARIADRVRVEPGSTEFHSDLRALPEEVLSFFGRNPNAETYQFIVRAVPRAWAKTGDEEPAPALPRGTVGASIRAELEKLQQEWTERGLWGQSLERELASARSGFAAYRAQSEAVSAELTTATRALQQSLSERAATAEKLAQLQRRFDRTINARLRKAAKFVRSAAFTGIVGGAAIPFAAVLGAAALAADGLGKVLPRKQPLLPQKTKGPRLATIQILNYEGRELLERNIPSVLAAVAYTGQPHRVVVVDNGSADGSLDFLRERFPQVTVVPLDRNYFFSKGNNQGVPRSDTEILVLLNNDMLVEPDFLPPLLKPFDDESVFAVSSQIFFRAPGKRREETGLTRARFEHGMLQYSHDAIPKDPAPLLPILWGGGGSCAFDRRKWLALGGLDEMYDPFYCEDLDLSLRAWQHGWKVLLATESKVWHEHRATSARFFGESFVNEIFRRNSYLLHWANLRDPTLLGAHLLHLPLLAAADVRRHGRSGARSLFKAAAKAPQALARRFRRSRSTGEGPSDRTILEETNLAAPEVLFTAPKKLKAGATLEIVMVTPYHFWPIQHGGAVRMYNVAKQLAARGNKVSVVGFVDTDEQLEAASHLREFCAEVRLLKRGPHGSGRFGLTPQDVLEFDQAVLHRELNALIASRDPDVVQVEYTQLAPYGRPSQRAAVCLTEHDIAFVSLYRHAMTKPSLFDRAAAYTRYLRMFHFELESLRRFDIVFTVSEVDASLLRPYLPGVHLSSAGRIGVDAGRFTGTERRPEPATLLFVGFMGHRPNVDALLHFCRETLPLIHARNPDVKLDVVGLGAAEEVLRLADDPRIRVLGFADDLRPHYARATLFVAPIRIAAGVRVKILEAFGAGVPVVSTHAGAEGLPVEDGRELALAATPEEFARQTLRLLADPAAAAALAGNARKLAGEQFDWANIAAELEKEYRMVLMRKGILDS